MVERSVPPRFAIEQKAVATASSVEEACGRSTVISPSSDQALAISYHYHSGQFSGALDGSRARIPIRLQRDGPRTVGQCASHFMRVESVAMVRRQDIKYMAHVAPIVRSRNTQFLCMLSYRQLDRLVQTTDARHDVIPVFARLGHVAVAL